MSGDFSQLDGAELGQDLPVKETFVFGLGGLFDATVNHPLFGVVAKRDGGGAVVDACYTELVSLYYGEVLISLFVGRKRARGIYQLIGERRISHLVPARGKASLRQRPPENWVAIVPFMTPPILLCTDGSDEALRAVSAASHFLVATTTS